MKPNNTLDLDSLDNSNPLKINKSNKTVADLPGNKAPINQKEVVKLREKVLSNGNKTYTNQNKIAETSKN